jgi:hypothetical protein
MSLSLYQLILQAGPPVASGGSSRSRLDPSKPTADPYYQKYRNELLKIIQGYETDANRDAAIERRDRLAAAVKLEGIRQKALTDHSKIKSENFRKRLDSLVSMKNKLEASRTAWGKNYGMRYTQVVDAARNKLRRIPSGAIPVDRFSRVMTAVAESPMTEAERLSVDDPRFLQTFREVVDIAQGGVPDFITFDDNGIATATDALKNRTTTQAENIRARIREYNERQSAYRDHEASMNSEAATLDNRIKAAEGLLSGAAGGQPDVAKMNQLIGDAESRINKLHHKFTEINKLPDQEKAQQEIQKIEHEEINSPGYRMALAEYRSLGGRAGSVEKQERDDMARMIGNPEFRQWAADHGYYNLGRAKLQADPKNPSRIAVISYVEGGEDEKAAQAWLRESKRRAGNFALFESPRTGDIVRFLDKGTGKYIEAERLKMHAADPYGAVRVVIDGKAVVYTPDQMSDFVMITQSSAPATTSEKYAAKRAVDVKGAFAKYYQEEATEAKETESPLFAVTLDKPLRLEKAELGKGMGFIVARDGTAAWFIDDEGKLEKLDEADAAVGITPQALLKSLESAKKTALGIKGDDELRWATIDDVTEGSTVRSFDYALKPTEVEAYRQATMTPATTKRTFTPSGELVAEYGVGGVDKKVYQSEEPLALEKEKKVVAPAPAPAPEPPPIKPPPVMSEAAQKEQTRQFLDDPATKRHFQPEDPLRLNPDMPVVEGSVEGLGVEGLMPDLSVTREMRDEVLRDALRNEPLEEPKKRRLKEGGVAGKTGQEEIIVGEEGPELVLPADVTEKILSLAREQGRAPEEEPVEQEAEAAEATEEDPEAAEDRELSRLQEGVAQRARGVYKLAKAAYKDAGLEPTPTISKVFRVVKMTQSLTQNVEYMKETLARAESVEKMSPEFYKHMKDFQFYSDRVTQLQDKIDELKKGMNLNQVVTQAKAEVSEQMKKRKGGSRD